MFEDPQSGQLKPARDILQINSRRARAAKETVNGNVNEVYNACDTPLGANVTSVLSKCEQLLNDR